jgi:L-amino acid N-acyltransferase
MLDRLPITIDLATAVDLPAINDIYNYYVLNSTTTYQEIPSSMEERLRWFTSRQPQHVVTVARQEGEVVGWASLNVFRERSAYRFSCENSVYVRHDLFRRGIGEALIRDSLVRANQHGFRVVVAGIDAEQVASIAIHRKCGFIEAGRFNQIGYKFDRWLDVVFMQYTV